MKNEKSFRKSVVGGFNPQDVSEYLAKLTREQREETEALRAGIEKLRKERDAALKGRQYVEMPDVEGHEFAEDPVGALSMERDKYRKEAEQLRTALEELQSKIDTYANADVDKGTESSRWEEERARLLSDKAKLETDKQRIEDEKLGLEEALARMGPEAKTTDEEIESLRRQVCALTEERDDLLNQRADWKKGDGNEEDDDDDVSAELRRVLTLQVERLESEKSALEAEVSRLVEERSTFTDEIDRLASDKAPFAAKIQRLEAEMAERIAECQDLKTRADTLMAERITFTAECERLEAENERLEVENERLGAERALAAAEEETVNAMKESFAAEREVLISEKNTLLTLLEEAKQRQDEFLSVQQDWQKMKDEWEQQKAAAGQQAQEWKYQEEDWKQKETEWNARLDSLTQREQALTQERDELLVQSARLRNEKAELSSMVTEMGSQTAELKKQIADGQLQADILRKRFEEENAHLESIKDRAEGIEKDVTRVIAETRAKFNDAMAFGRSAALSVVLEMDKMRDFFANFSDVFAAAEESVTRLETDRKHLVRTFVPSEFSEEAAAAKEPEAPAAPPHHPLTSDELQARLDALLDAEEMAESLEKDIPVLGAPLPSDQILKFTAESVEPSVSPGAEQPLPQPPAATEPDVRKETGFTPIRTAQSAQRQPGVPVPFDFSFLDHYRTVPKEPD